MAIVLFIVVFAAIVGGVGFLVYRMYKKMEAGDAENGVVSENSAEIDSAQKFLPFENIKDNIIDLGNYKYRMIVECSSVNYALKTDEEQEIIELGFQRVINSLQFPFTLYVQTREIDNRLMISSLEEDIAKSKEDFPILSDYGDEYLDEMKNLTVRLNQTKQKKKYIIIPYDEAGQLTKMDKDERFEYAKEEIYQRASMVRDAMASLQIKASILSTADIIELLYNSFHKDASGDVNPIINGEYRTMLVEGVFENKNNGQLLIGNRMAHMEPFEKLYLIFTQSEKWIKSEIMPMLTDLDDLALADAALTKLTQLRDSTENAYFALQEEKAAATEKAKSKARINFDKD